MSVSAEMIAYNIKYFREQLGLTQEDLAKKMVSSRSKIAKWENNSSTPDIESLIELCDLFEISLDHLVGREAYEKELLTDFKRLYKIDNDKDNSEIAQLMTYILRFDELKSAIKNLEELPLKKQQAIHSLLQNMIDELNKL